MYKQISLLVMNSPPYPTCTPSEGPKESDGNSDHCQGWTRTAAEGDSLSIAGISKPGVAQAICGCDLISRDRCGCTPRLPLKVAMLFSNRATSSTSAV